jgi:hypothetical protein
MAANESFDPLYSPQNGSDGLRKFSDELKTKIGKVLQFYIGDQSESIDYVDFSVPQNSCIYGKLIEVLDRFVILDCYYIDQRTKQMKCENRVCLNTFQIKAMSEIDGNGSLADIFLGAKDAAKIRKFILSGKM